MPVAGTFLQEFDQSEWTVSQGRDVARWNFSATNQDGELERRAGLEVAHAGRRPALATGYYYRFVVSVTAITASY